MKCTCVITDGECRAEGDAANEEGGNAFMHTYAIMHAQIAGNALRRRRAVMARKVRM
jgi:hypothetical protein